VKCLSLLQPWATLVAIGEKKIETRSWNTHYRGPLAIAASKRFSNESIFALLIPPFWNVLESAGYRQVEDYPVGSILCVCDLVDVVRITADNDPLAPERSFGNYTPGRYAWHLANVRALPEPIPAKGALGLWVPDAPVMEQLERFYGEAA
jgi:hypothetical protein